MNFAAAIADIWVASKAVNRLRGVVQKAENPEISSGCFQGGCNSHIAAGSPARWLQSVNQRRAIHQAKADPYPQLEHVGLATLYLVPESSPAAQPEIMAQLWPKRHQNALPSHSTSSGGKQPCGCRI